MTIFRCDLVAPEVLTFQFVSANEPDTIGVEVVLADRILIDISMDRNGQTSVLFDGDAGQCEFDLGQLRQVLDKCEADLLAWRARLIQPGEIWEPSV